MGTYLASIYELQYMNRLLFQTIISRWFPKIFYVKILEETFIHVKLYGKWWIFILFYQNYPYTIAVIICSRLYTILCSANLWNIGAIPAWSAVRVLLRLKVKPGTFQSDTEFVISSKCTILPGTIQVRSNVQAGPLTIPPGENWRAQRRSMNKRTLWPSLQKAKTR